ncbi:MAG: alpha-amylase family glycosyl hydrolase [Planctomycetota bacterium]
MSAILRLAVLAVVVAACLIKSAFGQAGFNDDRVMLQGFYWESSRHGDPDPRFNRFGTKRWYQIVKEQANVIRDAKFDLVWLPPPSYAGGQSAGYNPKQLWKLDNSYGDQALHRSMLETLLQSGVEPIADIVINHRDGDMSWVDFKNPDWGVDTITRNDEAFTNPASPVFNIPVAQRGAEEEKPTEYTTSGGTTYAYDSFRDIDHTNKQVQRDVSNICYNSSRSAIVAGATIWFMATTQNVWQTTTSDLIPHFLWANTTGINMPSSAGGSMPRPRTRMCKGLITSKPQVASSISRCSSR